MSTAEEYTWDIALEDGGPRRASLDDMGGDDMEDDLPLPDEARMWTASKGNQTAQQLAGLNRMSPACGITVRFTAGDPIVYQATGPGAAAVPGSFTPADNGDGDTTISWDEGTIPAPALGPTVSINDGTMGGGAVANYVEVDGLVTGVRVKTWAGESSAYDRNFTVIVR